jgi:hypothetical protein
MKIFISYRKKDSRDVTNFICTRLMEQFGSQAIFMDYDSIPPGVNWKRHLVEAVVQCDILLAVIGDHWLDIRYANGPKQGQRRLDDPADYVRVELLSALQRNIPVVPVLVGGASMPPEEALPRELRKLAEQQAAEVRTGRQFDSHMEKLIQAIKYHSRQENDDYEDDEEFEDDDPGNSFNLDLGEAEPPPAGPIRMQCPSCGAALRGLPGTKVRCPRCANVFIGGG